MNDFRFANVMNNTRINKTFNRDNSNIANMKTQQCQIMRTITNGILKEPMIKKPIVTNYTFLAVTTFMKINSFAYINSVLIHDLQNPFIKLK